MVQREGGRWRNTSDNLRKLAVGVFDGYYLDQLSRNRLNEQPGTPFRTCTTLI